eukprot:6693044-Prymnesium_polylepis.1
MRLHVAWSAIPLPRAPAPQSAGDDTMEGTLEVDVGVQNEKKPKKARRYSPGASTPGPHALPTQSSREIVVLDSEQKAIAARTPQLW